MASNPVTAYLLQQVQVLRPGFEEQAEQLLAIPFIPEFVFRSPQNLSGPRGTQREVADHLILHRAKGLLVSQKTKENPESRDERRNGFWVLNNAKGAVAQLIGALRSPETPFWCDQCRVNAALRWTS